MSLDEPGVAGAPAPRLRVALVALPHCDDRAEFEALGTDPALRLELVEGPGRLGVPDLIVLPGTEATIPDLQWLRETGIEAEIVRALAAGSVLVGICGGFQMMGTSLHDPEGVEGATPHAEGLRLFDLATTFARDGIDEPVSGTSSGAFLPAGATVVGHELHGGRSRWTGEGAVRLFDQDVLGGGSCPLGLMTPDARVIGTYLHGVLADAGFRARLVAHLRERRREAREGGSA